MVKCGNNIVKLQSENISTIITKPTAPAALPVMKWSLFAVPLLPSNDSVSQVFSGLGEYGKMWKLYRYENSPVDTLIEFQSGLSKVESGKSYWLKSRGENRYMSIDSGITVPVNKCYTIEIPPRKWVAISNPYMFSVSWKSILDSSFTTGASIVGPYTYTNSAWVPPVALDKINPWEGYYIYNITDKSITLRIPSLRYNTALAKTAPSDAISLEWTINGDDQVINNNFFGFSDGATEDYDYKTDYPKPSSPDNFVNTWFYNDGLKKAYDKFQTNFTNLSNGGSIWHVKVQNLKNGVVYNCSIGNIESLPDSLHAVIVDLSTNVKWDIERSAYAITGAQNKSTADIDIIVGTDAFIQNATGKYKLVPMMFYVSTLYPNPIRHLSRLDYTIPYDPDNLRVPVYFSVYTMNGRRVFTIEEPARTAGYYSIMLDVTTGPHILSSGTYVFKFTAGRNWKSQMMKVLH